jgi:predicted ATPase/tetratricopeptide (TPR) repeat protein
MTLHIRLLGGVQFSRDDQPISGFISNKVPALLAYLVANPRTHQRETLAALLWGEMADADSKNNLRQALTNLRKFFAPHLTITRETVQFTPQVAYSLDIEAFQTAYRAGDLQGAMSIYQGDFLEGFYVREAPGYEEWAFEQQARLREQALEALHRLMVAHTNCGEYSQASAYGNRLLALDPWREEIHRHLMLIQARSGQRSTALAQYKTCQKMLRKEFQVEPSEETTALYKRIKESLQKARHNLPASVTGFVGREAELQELRCMLASPEIRLVTILGPGGIGKTRLAMEAAASCETMFLNGVWFTPLEIDSPASPKQLMLAVANACGCVLSSPDALLRELTNFLQNKELLLVLDNLEDHLEAAGWLAELLIKAPEVKILATSRQRLNFQAEQVFRLEGLPTPLARQPAAEQHAAGQLFIQRARRVQAKFSPTDVEAAAIGQICRLVEGMPLGIELAAAWINELTCGEIADQIESNLDFLQANFRDLSPRHSTLRGVFEWSWNQLSPGEQAVFQRLAVFSGPFSREAAIEVAETTPAVLAGLVDKSLAWRLKGNYQLHQVARKFGAEKLRQAGEEAQTHDRHAAFYTRFLADQAEKIQGSEQAKALHEIESEFENIWAAWYWLIGQRETGQIGKAIDGLYHFTAVRSRFYQALELFSAARLALQSSSSASYPARLTYCRLTAREGRFLSFLSRFEEAKERLLESLGLLEGMDEPDELAFVLGHLGGTARMQGELAQAGGWLRQCLDLRKKTGNLAGQAVALLELAGVAFMGADYPAARDACLEGLAIAEKISDQQTLAHLLTGLGLCYRELGQHQLALNCCHRSLEIYQALGDRYGVVQASLTQAELNRQLGKYSEAEEDCQQAIRLSQEIGHSSGEADGHYRLGQVALSKGETARALSHQYQGLKLAATIQEVPLMLDLLYEIGTTLAHSGQVGEARVILAWLQCKTEISAARQRKIAEMLAQMVKGEHNLPAAERLSQEEIFQRLETYLIQEQILAST